MATIEINNTQLNIYWTGSKGSGYGHKKISVEFESLGNYKTFEAITDVMPDYDDATELEGEEKDLAFYNLIASKIEDSVVEWLEEINE